MPVRLLGGTTDRGFAMTAVTSERKAEFAASVIGNSGCAGTIYSQFGVGDVQVNPAGSLALMTPVAFPLITPSIVRLKSVASAWKPFSRSNVGSKLKPRFQFFEVSGPRIFPLLIAAAPPAPPSM